MEKKLYINHLYVNNRLGFTMIEFVVGIGVLSLVFSSMFSMFNYTIQASSLGENMDDMLLNGRFGIEFIKEEVRAADKIISAGKIEDLNFLYPNNIGFVLFTDMKKQDPSVIASERYRFVTYYLKNDKLVRISTNKGTTIYPLASKLSGHNELIHGVLSIEDSGFNHEDRLIHLKFSMGYDGKEFHQFKSCFYVDLDYDF